MKYSKLIAAVGALCATAAFAAPAPSQIAISSGASASKNNLKLALANRCTGTLTEFTDGTSNVSTYTCSSSGALTGNTYGASTPVNFLGTAFAELRLNVNGGSFTAICLLNNWVGNPNCPSPDQYVDPTTAGAGTTGTLAAPPAGSIVVGGLMDVEPAAFPFSVRQGLTLPTVVPAGFAQAFGVAVSSDLYTAMFNDQKGAGKLPSTCLVTDTGKPECVPVVGKAQMSSILSDNDFGNVYGTLGANYLAPSTLAVGTNLNYARRVDTSGTQASAQVYFMGTQCNPNALAVVPQGSATGTNHGAVTVYGIATTGNVRTLLNTTGQYTIGIMSGENAQSGQTWRWIRVGGMQMAENAQPDLVTTNTVSALDGRYDYWFESKIAQSSNINAGPFWTSVKTGFTAVPVGNTKGLFGPTESPTGLSKSGNACQNPAAQ